MSFSDCLTRSPDGQCLMLSSRDGYCTIVIFDEILPAHHTQQYAIQLQTIAQAHSVPLTTSSTAPTPLSTPSVTTSALPSATPSLSLTGLPALTPTPVATPTVPAKRSEPPPTPAASVDGNMNAGPTEMLAATTDKKKTDAEPPKKKRRVALTRVGDLSS
jgi:chromatin assembly factor 1 subunit B